MKRIIIFIIFSLCTYFCSGYNVPYHIILTLGEDITKIQITFSTPSLPTTPAVTFWPTTSPNESITIIANISDIHIFEHHPTLTDYITTITMTPLERGKEYSYYVSGREKMNETHSPTHTFYTMPKESDSLKIGIYGDLGAYGAALVEQGKGGLQYYAQKHKFDFIIHNGDLAYNLGSGQGKIGKEFLTNLGPVVTRIPYVVTPGNHEFMDDSEVFYRNWFLGQTLLGSTSNSSSPLMYFSFDIGSKLHIIVISTEVYCEDYPNLIPQHHWLEKDLASVHSRKERPWIIVFGHRQMYIGTTSTLHSRLMRLGLQCNDSSLQHCDYTRSCDSKKNCGYSIEHLFNKYNVDIYFAGHVHTYNRMNPIAENEEYETQERETYINPQHPVYVVSGAAGIEISPPKKEEVEGPLNSPTVVDTRGHSFSVLKVYNHTRLRLEQINVKNGKTIDKFYIERDPSRSPWSKKASLSLNIDKSVACDQ